MEFLSEIDLSNGEKTIETNLNKIFNRIFFDDTAKSLVKNMDLDGDFRINFFDALLSDFNQNPSNQFNFIPDTTSFSLINQTYFKFLEVFPMYDPRNDKEIEKVLEEHKNIVALFWEPVIYSVVLDILGIKEDNHMQGCFTSNFVFRHATRYNREKAFKALERYVRFYDPFNIDNHGSQFKFLVDMEGNPLGEKQFKRMWQENIPNPLSPSQENLLLELKDILSRRSEIHDIMFNPLMRDTRDEDMILRGNPRYWVVATYLALSKNIDPKDVDLKEYFDPVLLIHPKMRPHIDLVNADLCFLLGRPIMGHKEKILENFFTNQWVSRMEGELAILEYIMDRKQYAQEKR